MGFCPKPAPSPCRCYRDSPGPSHYLPLSHTNRPGFALVGYTQLVSVGLFAVRAQNNDPQHRAAVLGLSTWAFPCPVHHDICSTFRMRDQLRQAISIGFGKGRC